MSRVERSNKPHDNTPHDEANCAHCQADVATTTPAQPAPGGDAVQSAVEVRPLIEVLGIYFGNGAPTMNLHADEYAELRRDWDAMAEEIADWHGMADMLPSSAIYSEALRRRDAAEQSVAALTAQVEALKLVIEARAKGVGS